MSLDECAADLTVAERDQVHHAVMNAAATIQGHAELLRRRILQLDGLATLERDLLLGKVADIVAVTRRLADEVQTLTDGTEHPRRR